MDHAFKVASSKLKRVKVGLPGERATFTSFSTNCAIKLNGSYLYRLSCSVESDSLLTCLLFLMGCGPRALLGSVIVMQIESLFKAQPSIDLDGLTVE